VTSVASNSFTARLQASAKLHLAQLGLIVVLLALWQGAASARLIEASLFGTPLGILAYLEEGIFVTGVIVVDAGWTLEAVILAFLIGSCSAILVGGIFARWPYVERLTDPILSALNAMPRIALAPMFIMWFGLGTGSKVAVGVSLTFFIVLSATVAGVRAANADHLMLARTLGAGPIKIFRTIVLPGAVPMVFAGLRLGLVYAMLGVVGSEIIASRNGLGQEIAYLTSTFNIDGVMAIVFLLALAGYGVSHGMTRIERWLLRWQ
jgi:NitT/TauT family transport system permease protein